MFSDFSQVSNYLYSYSSIIKAVTRVESRSDDLDNLSHLGHFLVGQVGLISVH